MPQKWNMKRYHLISGVFVGYRLRHGSAFITLEEQSGKRVNRLLAGKALVQTMEIGSAYTIGYIEKPFFRHVVNIRPGIYSCEPENA